MAPATIGTTKALVKARRHHAAFVAPRRRRAAAASDSVAPPSPDMSCRSRAITITPPPRPVAGASAVVGRGHAGRAGARNSEGHAPSKRHRDYAGDDAAQRTRRVQESLRGAKKARSAAFQVESFEGNAAESGVAKDAAGGDDAAPRATTGEERPRPATAGECALSQPRPAGQEEEAEAETSPGDLRQDSSEIQSDHLSGLKATNESQCDHFAGYKAVVEHWKERPDLVREKEAVRVKGRFPSNTAVYALQCEKAVSRKNTNTALVDWYYFSPDGQTRFRNLVSAQRHLAGKRQVEEVAVPPIIPQTKCSSKTKVPSKSSCQEIQPVDRSGSKWSAEEDDELRKCVRLYGKNWNQILRKSSLLQERYRTAKSAHRCILQRWKCLTDEATADSNSAADAQNNSASLYTATAASSSDRYPKRGRHPAPKRPKRPRSDQTRYLGEATTSSEAETAPSRNEKGASTGGATAPLEGQPEVARKPLPELKFENVAGAAIAQLWSHSALAGAVENWGEDKDKRKRLFEQLLLRRYKADALAGMSVQKFSERILLVLLKEIGASTVSCNKERTH